MNYPNKTFHSQEEDEHHILSQNGPVSFKLNQTTGSKPQDGKKDGNLLSKIGIFILTGLLIVGVSIFTFRYLQMVEKHRQAFYRKEEVQANVQSIVQSELPDKSESYQKNYQQSKIYENMDLKNKGTQQDTRRGQSIGEMKEQQVQQGSQQQQQNSMQYNKKVQSGQFQAENSEEQISEDQIAQIQEKQLANSNSVEEAQLLNTRDQQKIDYIEVFNQQLLLHNKINQDPNPSPQNYGQQSSADQQAQLKGQDRLEVIQKYTINPELNQEKDLNLNQNLNALESPEHQTILKTANQDRSAKTAQESTTSIVNQQKTKTKLTQKPASSQLITEKDLYDPIIRVKQKMQKNLQSQFDDLIYIKNGTKIKEQQYYKARERMDMWKYFNPKTGALQLLEEVNYDTEIIADTQAYVSTIEKLQNTILQERLQYERKYQVSQFKQIPFCIIIPSYKNQDKYFRNLNSILQQDYQNYHIVYIDDASQDGTAEKVKAYIEKYQVPESRLKFIENKVNKKALPNIDYAARRLCNSGEIMAIIDGDDYLIGTQVFKVINARYQKQNLLALYTNHLRVHEPIYLKVGTCIDYPDRIKKTRAYRRFSIFPASHLRTFFVDLYWRINIRDLKDYQGQYFTAANDFAIMMPILEMAGERFEYLPQLTYVYDAGTGYNNFQTKADKQARNFRITKRRHKYPKLSSNLEFEKNLRAKGLMSLPQKKKPKASASNQSPGQKLKKTIQKGPSKA